MIAPRIRPGQRTFACSSRICLLTGLGLNSSFKLLWFSFLLFFDKGRIFVQQSIMFDLDNRNKMMNKITLTVLFLCLLAVNANSQLVHFEPLSWQQALGKARKENKMLFIEMFTTWCTYCRQMEQTVFPKAEVGSFYNQHFINVRYDAQKWDGVQIHKSYALPGFPAFLYLDPNGLLVLKTAGFQNKELFIKNADSAITLLQKKQSGKFSSIK